MEGSHFKKKGGIILLTDHVVRWDAHSQLVQNGRDGEDDDGRGGIRVTAAHKWREDVPSEIVRDRFVPRTPVRSQTVAVPPCQTYNMVSIFSREFNLAGVVTDNHRKRIDLQTS